MRLGRQLATSILLLLLTGTAGFAHTPASARQPDPARGSAILPWKHLLTGEDAARVEKLEKQIKELLRAGRFAEAIEPAREAADLRSRLQGADHWQAADARRAVEDLRTIAAFPEEGRRALASVEDLAQKADAERQRGHYAEAERIDRTLLEIRRKWLGDDHPDTAYSDLWLASNLNHQGRYAQAEPLHRKALAICVKALGEGHPGTASSYNNLAFNLDGQRKYSEAEPLHRKALAIRLKALGEDHPDTAASYNNLAFNLDGQGKYAEAEPLHREALTIRLKTLGEDHPFTAITYGHLAVNLDHQGKYAEAEPLHRKALAIRLKALGDGHANTARSYNNLAHNLNDQGKYTEAEPLHRKALAIYHKALGDDHPDTAFSYSNLAANLDALGRYAEAEPLHRKALAIRLKALGGDHPDTAASFNNLALNLNEQGKYAEAEPLHRKALAIRLKALGGDHPDTAVGYHNLGFNLNAQGRYAEAEPLVRQALAIRLKVLGESHPVAAFSYNNLAFNLDGQRKYREAEPLHRKALAIRLETLGEGHPDIAPSYNNLAANLNAQGRHAEAEPLFRRALAIRLKALGEDNPKTVQSYNSLAYNLDAQGKLAEAVANWTAAATIHERTRGAQSASRLERSLNPLRPLPALAVALARQGQPREAWICWESDLARGLLDDLSARQLRPLKPDQRRREAELAGQLQRLDERISRLAAKTRHTQDEDKQIDALREQQSELRGRWIEFQNALDRQYQAYAGKPSTLAEVQKALPAKAALIGWLDEKTHHWACIVRHEGDPLWVRIPGSDSDGGWTKEDDERSGKLRGALANNQPAWGANAEIPARQRLEPLIPHLEGVKHLIILPSRALAGVPVEALVSALPAGSPQPVISYAPSASMFARLTTSRPGAPGLPRLLALGDPAFPEPARDTPAPPPPAYGIPIVAVAPNGIAGLFGIRPGDILLEYDGKMLRSASDLTVVPVGSGAARIAVKTWRDGEVRAFEIAPGPLGVQVDRSRSAAEFVAAQRAALAILTSKLGFLGMPHLPGTRREVEAIATLFPKDQTTVLLGTDATESKLQGLAQSGELKGYRFIHLATHGKANRDVAMNSAIFLAAEPEGPKPSADPTALESAPDGEVTAEQIVRTWDLDADLVVLSACESGLGREAGGEGYLGFAQALFVKGARSLVLSQWSVEDNATALLMTRFYRNLLRQRPGLSKPMPKAEALHEAKNWLRNLTADEVGSELAALDRGPVRPLAKDSGGAAQGASAASRSAGLRPYAHPYYWAAFILVGDPD